MVNVGTHRYIISGISMISILILTVILFYILEFIEDSGLVGASLVVENLLRYSTVTMVIPMIIIVFTIQSENKHIRRIPIYIFLLFLVHNAFSIASVLFFRRKIIRRFGYLFENEIYSQKATEIQERMKCCGWMNFSQPAKGSLCQHLVGCFDAINLKLNHKVPIYLFGLICVTAMNLYGLIGSYYLSRQKTNAQSDFEQLTQSQLINVMNL